MDHYSFVITSATGWRSDVDYEDVINISPSASKFSLFFQRLMNNRKIYKSLNILIQLSLNFPP